MNQKTSVQINFLFQILSFFSLFVYLKIKLSTDFCRNIIHCSVQVLPQELIIFLIEEN